MQPPKNIQPVDLMFSTVWIDDDGILCSVSKNVVPQTLEEVRQSVEEFKMNLETENFAA